MPAPRSVRHPKSPSAASSEAGSFRGRSRGVAAVGNPSGGELNLQRQYLSIKVTRKPVWFLEWVILPSVWC